MGRLLAEQMEDAYDRGANDQADDRRAERVQKPFERPDPARPRMRRDVDPVRQRFPQVQWVFFEPDVAD